MAMQDQYTEHCGMVFARIFYYITVVFGTPKSAVGRDYHLNLPKQKSEPIV